MKGDFIMDSTLNSCIMIVALNIMHIKCKLTFIHDDSVSRFSGEILVRKN